MDILLLLVGLGLILGGANFLTDGSAAVAQRFRVPEFIIGRFTPLWRARRDMELGEALREEFVPAGNKISII